MDEYQIPTIDGRYVTLRYDEQHRETVILFPPPVDEDDETEPAFGFTVENAKRFADALLALQARPTNGAIG
jgi:hypothetical protein